MASDILKILIKTEHVNNIGVVYKENQWNAIATDFPSESKVQLVTAQQRFCENSANELITK